MIQSKTVSKNLAVKLYKRICCKCENRAKLFAYSSTLLNLFDRVPSFIYNAIVLVDMNFSRHEFSQCVIFIYVCCALAEDARMLNLIVGIQIYIQCVKNISNPMCVINNNCST